jgi:hypothetical protein
MPSCDTSSPGDSTAARAISEEHREVRPLQTAELHLLRPARDVTPSRTDPPGDAVTLRALLAERERRLAEKDEVIIELRHRLIVAEAERLIMVQRLCTRAREPGPRRLKGTMQAVGRLLDFCADMMLPPPIPEMQQIEAAGAHDEARDIAGRMLLDHIARLRQNGEE